MARGFYKDMTEEQRHRLISLQYKRMLEERQGHNYEYWNEKHEKMIEDGWQLHSFNGKKEATRIEDDAILIVNELRSTGYNARIVCGYCKDVQRTKYYSVIYSSHANKTRKQR